MEAEVSDVEVEVAMLLVLLAVLVVTGLRISDEVVADLLVEVTVEVVGKVFTELLGKWMLNKLFKSVDLLNFSSKEPGRRIWLLF